MSLPSRYLNEPGIRMMPLNIANGGLQITIGTDPFSIISIKNRLTGQTFCSGGTQSIIVRTPGRLSDPIFLTEVVSISRSDASIKIEIADEDRQTRATITIDAPPGNIRFHAEVRAPQPIWMAEWCLAGLKSQEVIVPALGGQSLNSTMPVGTTLSYKYPFWWNAQFVIGASTGGGWWLRTKDRDPKFKMLRVKRAGAGFALTLGFEADAPLSRKELEATWYMDCYKGDWTMPVGIHRDWMEREFDLTPLEENPHFPAWAHDVNLILEIWGMRKDSPVPHHTFEEMELILRRWARRHPPKETLVYLPGYAEHGIDSRAPNYRPSVELGGEKKFARLVKTAHRLGYHVMIHTNVLGMTFDHPLFRRFKKHQVVDLFDRPQGWGMDIDGDWLSEPYFAYINPGASAWGDLMQQTLGALISKYGLDAVFLDQTLLAFNVSRGPNFLSGMRDHIRRLQKAFPSVLFAGEGLNELVQRSLPMAQIHGIDSLAEVHALEGAVPWRKAHPVSTYLFGRYTRFTAHLLTRHPSHPMFKFQEEAYRRLGVIPALCLYNTSQSTEGAAVSQMIRRARQLSRTFREKPKTRP